MDLNVKFLLLVTYRFFGGYMRSRVVLAALLAFISLSTAQAQTKLRVWNLHGEGYPVTLALESFVKEVNELSAGRFQLELFNKGVLGDQPKAISMMKAGDIDFAEFSSGALSDAAPGIKALNLPFLFRDSTHMFRHLDGKLGRSFADKLKASGLVVLGWYDGGGRSFYCSHKPITNIRDLAGAKIRVQSEVFMEMVKLIDGTALQIPFKDVMQALEDKKIDCAENNMPSYESTGHYKIAKNVYMTNHVVSAEPLVVSTKLWDKLSEQDRKLLTEAGQKSALLMRKLWVERVKLSVEKTTKEGSKFVPLKDADRFIGRLSPLYAKFLSSPDTRTEVSIILGNQY